MEYMTINEASTKWEISIRQVCSLCNQGKIQGALKKQIWLIPKDAEKPITKRKRKQE